MQQVNRLCKSTAEVLSSSFEILLGFCAKFEHSYFEFPHFTKPLISDNCKETAYLKITRISTFIFFKKLIKMTGIIKTKFFSNLRNCKSLLF